MAERRSLSLPFSTAAQASPLSKGRIMPDRAQPDEGIPGDSGSAEPVLAITVSLLFAIKDFADEASRISDSSLVQYLAATTGQDWCHPLKTPGLQDQVHQLLCECERLTERCSKPNIVLNQSDQQLLSSTLRSVRQGLEQMVRAYAFNAVDEWRDGDERMIAFESALSSLKAFVIAGAENPLFQLEIERQARERVHTSPSGNPTPSKDPEGQDSPGSSDGMDDATESEDEPQGGKDHHSDGPPAGFLGGADLARVLSIAPSRKDAFFKRLERERRRLGDDCWRQVRSRQANSPEYLYRTGARSIRAIAKDYQSEKPT